MKGWSPGGQPNRRLSALRRRDLRQHTRGTGRCAIRAPGALVTINLRSTGDRTARQVCLVAGRSPVNWPAWGVLILHELAGIPVVLVAARLAWTRPGRMSGGFFRSRGLPLLARQDGDDLPKMGQIVRRPSCGEQLPQGDLSEIGMLAPSLEVFPRES